LRRGEAIALECRIRHGANKTREQYNAEKAAAAEPPKIKHRQLNAALLMAPE